VDATGAAYVTGSTQSTDFPTASAIQTDHGGGFYDAFVTKINAAGSALVYSIYLGGSGNELASGIVVDATGAAYVMGFTDSTGFPMASPIQGTSGGGYDAFVTKIADATPTPEVCDGVDNDLDGTVDEGFPDLDADGVADCVDSDDDGVCAGKPVTIRGTSRSEILMGTSGPDVILGLGGHDRINGLGGDDTICGGEGNDTIRGGTGHDKIYAEGGNDRIKAGRGNDLMDGGEGNDKCYGQLGSDTAHACEKIRGVP
jgi:Ca2+-binding RTX toxin-like protein